MIDVAGDRKPVTSDATIRRLTPANADSLRTLRLEALRAHPAAFTASLDADERLTAGDFARRMVLPDAIFGAFAAGELIGMTGFAVEKVEKRSHRGLIWGVYLRATWRGQGIAESLLRAAIDHARDHVEVLTIAVGVHNEPARRLYRRLGFEPWGIEPRALRVDGVDYDEEHSAIVF